MQWLRNLFARHLNANKPGNFWNNVGACMTIAFYLSLNLWAFFVILGRIIFYEFFLLGRGLRWYFPIFFAVILYRLIDKDAIKATLSHVSHLNAVQKKKFRRRTGIFYTVSFDMLIIAIIVSPYVRPSHDRVLAAYYGESEYRRYSAIYEMGNSKDSFYIKHLMCEIDDYRDGITLNSKGTCFATQKTFALSKITNDVNINAQDWGTVDSSVVNYWKRKYPQYYVPHWSQNPLRSEPK